MSPRPIAATSVAPGNCAMGLKAPCRYSCTPEPASVTRTLPSGAVTTPKTGPAAGIDGRLGVAHPAERQCAADHQHATHGSQQRIRHDLTLLAFVGGVSSTGPEARPTLRLAAVARRIGGGHSMRRANWNPVVHRGLSLLHCSASGRDEKSLNDSCSCRASTPIASKRKARPCDPGIREAGWGKTRETQHGLPSC